MEGALGNAPDLSTQITPALKQTKGQVFTVPSWKVGKKGRQQQIKHTCPRCGQEKWVDFRKGKPARTHCIKCAPIVRLARRNILRIVHELMKEKEERLKKYGGTSGTKFKH